MRNKIRSFLDARGITRYRFRADIGIAASTAYDLYGDPDRLPNSSVLAKICQHYRVQPNEIIEWIPDESLESAE
ncbi:MAG: helix-turn-helix transcriptional regulator [Myxacorys chilensis ATA2-1-KO14]|jgi:DNA-binding Xre family transcriptional regulator|nr:helix-turn-helix transcriptional regulator [Myxacorys chilensis ATA2-1-KO14]